MLFECSLSHSMELIAAQPHSQRMKRVRSTGEGSATSVLMRLPFLGQMQVVAFDVRPILS